MDLLTTFQKSVTRPPRPDVRPGDTVRVTEKIKEGGKERLAVFEGLVIARKHGSEPGAAITVRKISFGVGVERIFPLWAPTVVNIEIMRRAKVRRAKLHFIRKRVGKRATLRGELVPPEIGKAEAEEEPQEAAEEVSESVDEEQQSAQETKSQESAEKQQEEGSKE